MLSTAKSVFALVLLLLAIVFPAAAAADDMTSSSDNLAPTSTASSLPTSSASSEYTFTFPAYSSPQNFLVSYKDTIVVSWTSHKPNNPPYLQIQCWNRNSTTSPECTYNNTGWPSRHILILDRVFRGAQPHSKSHDLHGLHHFQLSCQPSQLQELQSVPLRTRG